MNSRYSFDEGLEIVRYCDKCDIVRFRFKSGNASKHNFSLSEDIKCIYFIYYNSENVSECVSVRPCIYVSGTFLGYEKVWRA